MLETPACHNLEYAAFAYLMSRDTCLELLLILKDIVGSFAHF